MGENAKKEWEWHNNQVGYGYQAKGVVRQSNAKNVQIEKVIDMRGNNTTVTTSANNRQSETQSVANDRQVSSNKDSNTNQNEKKHKHHSDNIERKHHKHKKTKVDVEIRSSKLHFDPLMQLFITKLKDAAQE